MEDKPTYQGPPVEFPDKSEIAGIVVAAAPFICSFSSTSTVNGEVVSQTDFVAIALGIVAILIALSTIRLWAQTPESELMKRRILFVVTLGLGAFQLVRGLGML